MTRLHDLAARFARGLLSNFLTLQTEGAGNAGCTLHPRSRVQKCAKRRTRAYRFSGGIRHSLRNGFTAYIVLSPAGRARCHRRPRKLASHELDASIGASGPHDFAVRIRAVRQRHIRVHRIPSRACDDRETPLVPGRDQIDILLIWPSRQRKFRKIRNLPGLQSSRFTLQVILLYACPRQSAHAARDRSDCPWANWRGSGRE